MAAEPKITAGDDRVLPPKIWTEILTRLPAKSILRCRSVCKSWYSRVSCPSFVSDYSLRNLNKYGKRLLLQYESLRPYSSHDRSFMDSREHDDVPEGFLGFHVRIVGSCNGLICLSKYNLHDFETLTFLIWNPTIRKVVELPARGFVRGFHSRFSYNGFGFDFKTGDYKVMCMHHVYLGRNNVCEIYDLRKGVWRDIRPPMCQWNVRGPTPECYLNGAVHWTGFRGSGSPDRILLSFDMSDEIFRETRLPDCSEFVWNDWDHDDETGIGTRSVTLSGLIHVIVWKMKHDAYISQGSVWAMQEYGVAESWTKIYNIDQLRAEVDRDIDPNTFLLLENGEILIKYDISAYEEHLILYNVWSGECEQLFSCSTLIEDMCLFEESLVLM